jgi:hypothetical protein
MRMRIWHSWLCSCGYHVPILPRICRQLRQFGSRTAQKAGDVNTVTDFRCRPSKRPTSRRNSNQNNIHQRQTCGGGSWILSIPQRRYQWD